MRVELGEVNIVDLILWHFIQEVLRSVQESVFGLFIESHTLETLLALFLIIQVNVPWNFESGVLLGKTAVLSIIFALASGCLMLLMIRFRVVTVVDTQF